MYQLIQKCVTWPAFFTIKYSNDKKSIHSLGDTFNGSFFIFIFNESFGLACAYTRRPVKHLVKKIIYNNMFFSTHVWRNHWKLIGNRTFNQWLLCWQFRCIKQNTRQKSLFLKQMALSAPLTNVNSNRTLLDMFLITLSMIPKSNTANARLLHLRFFSFLEKFKQSKWKYSNGSPINFKTY